MCNDKQTLRNGQKRLCCRQDSFSTSRILVQDLLVGSLCARSHGFKHNLCSLAPGKGFEPLRRKAPPAYTQGLSPKPLHLEAGTLPLCHPGTQRKQSERTTSSKSIFYADKQFVRSSSQQTRGADYYF